MAESDDDEMLKAVRSSSTQPPPTAASSPSCHAQAIALSLGEELGASAGGGPASDRADSNGKRTRETSPAAGAAHPSGDEEALSPQQRRQRTEDVEVRPRVFLKKAALVGFRLRLPSLSPSSPLTHPSIKLRQGQAQPMSVEAAAPVEVRTTSPREGFFLS